MLQLMEETSGSQGCLEYDALDVLDTGRVV